MSDNADVTWLLIAILSFSASCISYFSKNISQFKVKVVGPLLAAKAKVVITQSLWEITTVQKCRALLTFKYRIITLSQGRMLVKSAINELMHISISEEAFVLSWFTLSKFAPLLLFSIQFSVAFLAMY